MSELTKCAGCSRPILQGEKVVTAPKFQYKSVWHAECFKCVLCGEEVNHLNYCTKDDQIFCERHYNQQQQQQQPQMDPRMESMTLPPPYSSLSNPIVSQPVTASAPFVGMETGQCPEHLEGLIDTEKIRFKQEVQIIQIVCGCDMPISFDLINERDQILFRAEEQDHCLMRNCVPQGFRTESLVSKTNGLFAFKLKREARCVFNCCMPCCCYKLPFSSERLSVTGYQGTLLGTVEHDWSIGASRLSVKDASGKVVIKIVGPGCNFSCCSDLKFQLLDLNGTEIGSITKHDMGTLCEVFADFDNFTLNFPRNLDVPIKATLIGAVSLINFLFFQGSLRRLFCGITVGTLNAMTRHPR